MNNHDLIRRLKKDDDLSARIEAAKLIKSLTAKLEAATKALEILDTNSYSHHTPHMICVPTEHWKRAMSTTTGEEL